MDLEGLQSEDLETAVVCMMMILANDMADAASGWGNGCLGE